MEQSSTSLYLVPTPIGNLEDITLRAIRILKDCDLILAEDTRKTSVLLKCYQISTPMKSFHAHNEHKTLRVFIKLLKEDKIIAQVSDAGTPGISDPGYLLVRECLQEGIGIECLPGATSFVPALVKSGIPCDRFIFEGFLPHKKGRTSRLDSLVGEQRTMVFFESPHRLLKSLNQMIEYFGADRQASVSREISKIHEETINLTLGELVVHFSDRTIKGEIVIVVAGEK